MCYLFLCFIKIINLFINGLDLDINEIVKESKIIKSYKFHPSNPSTSFDSSTTSTPATDKFISFPWETPIESVRIEHDSNVFTGKKNDFKLLYFKFTFNEAKYPEKSKRSNSIVRRDDGSAKNSASIGSKRKRMLTKTTGKILFNLVIINFIIN